MHYQVDAETRPERGVALMLALVYVVLLTVLVTSFVYEAQVDANAVAFSDRDADALLSARSSVSEALSLLETDLLQNETIDEDIESGEIFDSLEDVWANPPSPAGQDGVVSQLTITDEYGKINLNALVFEDGGEEKVYLHLEMALRVLFAERGMRVDPVDAILDWLDSDDQVRPEGYETGFYQALDPPYQAKNGPMDSIEELLLIPGITADVYFGTAEETTGPPLFELLTVHGHPQGMVNINTAPEEVLVAMLAAQADPTNVDIVGAQETMALLSELFEEHGPFTTVDSLRDFKPAPPPQPDPDEESPEAPQPIPVADFFDIRSSVFRIQGDAASGNASVRVQVFVWRATDEFAAPGESESANQMIRVIDWQVIR